MIEERGITKRLYTTRGYLIRRIGTDECLNHPDGRTSVYRTLADAEHDRTRLSRKEHNLEIVPVRVTMEEAYE
jgi:hypothetical protein